jgi:hypothetical protein
MNSTIGKLLIFIGILFVLLGLIFLFTKNIPIGRLPGDIYIKKDNFSFYFPITTMVVISIIISFLIYIIGKK